MTSISDMKLLDEVVEKVANAILELVADWDFKMVDRLVIAESADGQDGRVLIANAAIRAALQAMVDTGMAEIMEKPNWGKPPSRALIIRLDNADEREREEPKP